MQKENVEPSAPSAQSYRPTFLRRGLAFALAPLAGLAVVTLCLFALLALNPEPRSHYTSIQLLKLSVGAIVIFGVLPAYIVTATAGVLLHAWLERHHRRGIVAYIALGGALGLTSLLLLRSTELLLRWSTKFRPPLSLPELVEFACFVLIGGFVGGYAFRSICFGRKSTGQKPAGARE